jgi:hypothetical protein
LTSTAALDRSRGRVARIAVAVTVPVAATGFCQ